MERELASILGRVTHHVHPEIVDYITQENITYSKVFSKFSHHKLDMNPYFYDQSDCIFPGFRRPVNKEKTGSWKNKVLESDGTILNDNTFPRHVWAFLSMNKAYSGGKNGMWSKSNLNSFELAHIFGHKEDERSLESEVFNYFSDDVKPYGLFTSASNVVLIPKGFAKPTDQMRNIKLCFYKRHIELYGYNMVGLAKLNENILPSWYDEIMWLEPELPNNWKAKVNNLLQYREKYLKNKYK